MREEGSTIHLVAQTGPWLAPLPSAWFVGRSIYYHLLFNWTDGAINVWPGIHIAVAAIAGLTIETLGIVSVYTALATHRWNDMGNVSKEKGAWESAPFGLAVLCTIGYMVAAIVLLIVLEAMPDAARYAPIMFPVMGIVAAVNLGILDQHASRLRRYNLTWDLIRYEEKTEPDQAPASQAASVAAPLPVVLQKPSLDNWRVIYRGLNGERTNLDRDTMIEILARHGFEAPKPRSQYDWVNEAKAWME